MKSNGHYVKASDVRAILDAARDYSSASELLFFKGIVHTFWRLGYLEINESVKLIDQFCEMKGIENVQNH